MKYLFIRKLTTIKKPKSFSHNLSKLKILIQIIPWSFGSKLNFFMKSKIMHQHLNSMISSFMTMKLIKNLKVSNSLMIK